MSNISRSSTPNHAPGATPTTSEQHEPGGEPQYQTGKGCLMILGMMLVAAAITVIVIILFGNRTA